MPIPTLKKMEFAYQQLLHCLPRLPSANELALYSQWTRFDPRLGEIWVDFIQKNWQKYNPSEILSCARQQNWPSVFGVLLEFAKEKNTTDRSFPFWCGVITEQLPKGKQEQYFLGLRQLAAPSMIDDVRFSKKEYKKWGYFSQEKLIRNIEKRPLSFAEREEILARLLIDSHCVSTKQYWQKLGRCISMRQAERDLRKCTLLRKIGQTKGRRYLKK